LRLPDELTLQFLHPFSGIEVTDGATKQTCHLAIMWKDGTKRSVLHQLHV
jgi:hypothetical protein